MKSDSAPDNGLGECVIRRVDKFFACRAAALINTGITGHRARLIVTGTCRIGTMTSPVKCPLLAFGIGRAKSVNVKILAKPLVNVVPAAIVLRLGLKKDTCRLRLPANNGRPAGAN